MSNKLQVLNLPGKLQLSEVQQLFGQFKGFKSAHFLYSQNNVPVAAIVEYEDVNYANIAKISMSNFQFDPSYPPLIIDFVKEERGHSSIHSSQMNHSQVNLNPLVAQNLQGFHQLQMPGQVSMQQLGGQEVYTSNPYKSEMQGFQNVNVISTPMQNTNVAQFQQQFPQIQIVDSNQQHQLVALSQQHANSLAGAVQGHQSTYINAQGQIIGTSGPQIISFANPTTQNVMPQLSSSRQMSDLSQSGGSGQMGAFEVLSKPQNANLLKEAARSVFEVPADATNSIYVDGIPNDATEREVSHVFRPFPGFCGARLILKETKSGRKYFYCFVDFENSIQASICMQTLQGYRFDSKESRTLKLAFATPTNLIRKRKSRRNRSRSR